MKVLIAYDGSESAKASISDLSRAGLPVKTEVVVITAADILPGLLEKNAGSEPDPGPIIRARAEASRAMTEAKEISSKGAEQVRSLFPGWNVLSEAIADSPWWAFIHRANALGSDMIVVGSRGRSTLQAVILGSVSQNVLHYASCSVRVGRGSRRETSGSPVRILIAVDGSSNAAAAVSVVASRSWPAGSEARIVTAAHGQTLPLLFDAETNDHQLSPAIETMAGQLRRAGLSVTTVVRQEDPKHLIISEAEQWPADCIFVGARGLSRIERIMLGSVSGAVAARAHCSVEVVRVAAPR